MKGTYSPVDGSDIVSRVNVDEAEGEGEGRVDDATGGQKLALRPHVTAQYLHHVIEYIHV